MATVIRPEVSTRNKYWIDKHRHYELKHFCLQYPMWRKRHAEVLNSCISAAKIEREHGFGYPSDITAKYAIRKEYYSNRIKMVEEAALNADKDLYMYILKGVTEGLSYTYLKTKLDIPCGKDMYYDRYRKFFWLLNKARN